MKRNKDMRSFFVPIGKRKRESEGDEQEETEEREQVIFYFPLFGPY